MVGLSSPEVIFQPKFFDGSMILLSNSLFSLSPASLLFLKSSIGFFIDTGKQSVAL